MEKRKERIQVWLSESDFDNLLRLFHNDDASARIIALAEFENEGGPLLELLVALEEARDNNANYVIAHTCAWPGCSNETPSDGHKYCQEHGFKRD